MGVQQSLQTNIPKEENNSKEFIQNQFDFSDFSPIENSIEKSNLIPTIEQFSSGGSKHKTYGEKYLSVRTPRPRHRNYGYRDPYYGYGYYPGTINVVDPSGIYNPIPTIPSYGYNSFYNPVPVIVPSLVPEPGIIPFPPDGISGSFSNMVNPYYGSIGVPDYGTSCGGTECNYYPGINNKGFNSRCSCCSKGKKCRNPKISPFGVKYQDCCKGLTCKTTFSSDTYGHCS